MNPWLLLAIVLAIYAVVVAFILRIFAWLGAGADRWDRTMADHTRDEDQ